MAKPRQESPRVPDVVTWLSLVTLQISYQRDQLTPLYRRIHDSLAAMSGVSMVRVPCCSPSAEIIGVRTYGSTGVPLPDLKKSLTSSWIAFREDFLDAAGNPIVRGPGIIEQDTAISRRGLSPESVWRESSPLAAYFRRVSVLLAAVALPTRQFGCRLPREHASPQALILAETLRGRRQLQLAQKDLFLSSDVLV